MKYQNAVRFGTKQPILGEEGGETSASFVRTGATLVEILMAMMVMSIGLVSVAAMFPISMLRSIQATQLTNSALLGFQCEDYLNAFPGCVTDHYHGPNPSDISHNREFRLDGIISRRMGPPNYRSLINAGVSQPITYVTVIDPVGYIRMGGGSNLNFFGNDSYGITGAGSPIVYAAERKNGGFNLANLSAQELAQSLFTSPDSWSLSLTSNDIAGTVGDNVLTLSDLSAGDLETFHQALNSGVKGRVVVFDRTGRQSRIFSVDSVAYSGPPSREITLTSLIPDNGKFGNIGVGSVVAIPEVRLELYEPRYTCLVTIRQRLNGLGPDSQPGVAGLNDDDPSNTDPASTDDVNEVGWPGSDDHDDIEKHAKLVVFYRRNFSPLAEQVYPVQNMIEDSPNPITIFWRGSEPDSKPRLQNGTWVFDPVNGYWYQVSKVLGTGVDRAQILLAQPPVKEASYLMVPENVVNVIDITVP